MVALQMTRAESVNGLNPPTDKDNALARKAPNGAVLLRCLARLGLDEAASCTSIDSSESDGERPPRFYIKCPHCETKTFPPNEAEGKLASDNGKNCPEAEQQANPCSEADMVASLPRDTVHTGDATTAADERPSTFPGLASLSCENCDADRAVWYCATCRAPLCQRCRDLTHAARLFQSHDIQLLTHYSAVDVQTRCTEHDRPYELYSEASQELLCVECMDGSHPAGAVIDVGTAHVMDVKKLQAETEALVEFKRSLEDVLSTLARLSVEVVGSYEHEKKRVDQLYEALKERLKEATKTCFKKSNDNSTQSEPPSYRKPKSLSRIFRK